MAVPELRDAVRFLYPGVKLCVAPCTILRPSGDGDLPRSPYTASSSALAVLACGLRPRTLLFLFCVGHVAGISITIHRTQLLLRADRLGRWLALTDLWQLSLADGIWVVMHESTSMLCIP